MAGKGLGRAALDDLEIGRAERRGVAGRMSGARRIGLEASTLSRNLRTLETEGLVEIAVVEGDLRRRAVWLTDKGARLLEAAVPVWRRAQTKLAKTLSPEIVRRLADETSALDPD